MQSHKKSNIISLVTYKQSMLHKVAVCFLILCFAVNSVAFGYDKDTFDRIRAVESGKEDEIDVIFRELGKDLDIATDKNADLDEPVKQAEETVAFIQANTAAITALGNIVSPFIVPSLAPAIEALASFAVESTSPSGMESGVEVDLSRLKEIFGLYNLGKIEESSILAHSYLSNGVKVLFIKTQQGEYVLKSYPLELEERHLEKIANQKHHLRKNGFPLSIPDEIPARDGRKVIIEDDRSFMLYPWAGPSLRETELDMSENIRKTGMALAMYLDAAESLVVPDERVSGHYLLPLDNIAKVRSDFNELTGRVRKVAASYPTKVNTLFLSEQLQRLCLDQISILEKELTPALYARLRKSAIHGDIYDRNILSSRGRNPGGLIDYDDSRMASRLEDIVMGVFHWLNKLEKKHSRESGPEDIMAVMQDFLINCQLYLESGEILLEDEMKALLGFLRASLIYEIFYRAILAGNDDGDYFYNTEIGGEIHVPDMERIVRYLALLESVDFNGLQPRLDEAREARDHVKDAMERLGDRPQDEILDEAFETSDISRALLERAYSARIDIVELREGPAEESTSPSGMVPATGKVEWKSKKPAILFVKHISRESGYSRGANLTDYLTIGSMASALKDKDFLRRYADRSGKSEYYFEEEYDYPSFDIHVVDLAQKPQDATTIEDFIDEYIKLTEIDPIMVCVSSTSAQLDESKEVAEAAARLLPDALRVIGGPHVSVLPDEYLGQTEFDVACIGEGIESITELAFRVNSMGDPDYSDVANIAYKNADGSINLTTDLNTQPEYVMDLDEYPHPSDSLGLFVGDINSVAANRAETVFIYAGSGCPMNCSYCAQRAIRRGVVRSRSAESIYDEITGLHEKGFRRFVIVQESFMSNMNRVERFLKLIEEGKIDFKWTIETRADQLNKDLLVRMRANGLEDIQIGLETGDQRLLDSVDKKLKLEQVAKVVEWCRALRVNTHFYMMVGLPGQDWQSILRSAAFLAQNTPYDTLSGSISVFIVMPYPGTDIAAGGGIRLVGLDVDKLNMPDRQPELLFTEDGGLEGENFTETDVMTSYEILESGASLNDFGFFIMHADGAQSGAEASHYAVAAQKMLYMIERRTMRDLVVTAHEGLTADVRRESFAEILALDGDAEKNFSDVIEGFDNTYWILTDFLTSAKFSNGFDVMKCLNIPNRVKWMKVCAIIREWSGKKFDIARFSIDDVSVGTSLNYWLEAIGADDLNTLLDRVERKDPLTDIIGSSVDEGGGISLSAFGLEFNIDSENRTMAINSDAILQQDAHESTSPSGMETGGVNVLARGHGMEEDPKTRDLAKILVDTLNRNSDLAGLDETGYPGLLDDIIDMSYEVSGSETFQYSVLNLLNLTSILIANNRDDLADIDELFKALDQVNDTLIPGGYAIIFDQELDLARPFIAVNVDAVLPQSHGRISFPVLSLGRQNGSGIPPIGGISNRYSTRVSSVWAYDYARFAYDYITKAPNGAEVLNPDLLFLNARWKSKIEELGRDAIQEMAWDIYECLVREETLHRLHIAEKMEFVGSGFEDEIITKLGMLSTARPVFFMLGYYFNRARAMQIAIQDGRAVRPEDLADVAVLARIGELYNPETWRDLAQCSYEELLARFAEFNLYNKDVMRSVRSIVNNRSPYLRERIRSLYALATGMNPERYSVKSISDQIDELKGEGARFNNKGIHVGTDLALSGEYVRIPTHRHQTHLFRHMGDREEKEAFDLFIERMAERVNDGQRVRILCAGCSTGQEAYTIAIALLEKIDDGISWNNIRVVGIDSATLVIEEAQNLKLTVNDIDNLPYGLQKKYIVENRGQYNDFIAELKGIVRFENVDMNDEDAMAGLGLFDGITLMRAVYQIELEERVKVCANLTNASKEDGLLLTSMDSFGRMLFYRNENSETGFASIDTDLTEVDESTSPSGTEPTDSGSERGLLYNNYSNMDIDKLRSVIERIKGSRGESITRSDEDDIARFGVVIDELNELIPVLSGTSNAQSVGHIYCFDACDEVKIVLDRNGFGSYRVIRGRFIDENLTPSSLFGLTRYVEQRFMRADAEHGYIVTEVAGEVLILDLSAEQFLQERFNQRRDVGVFIVPLADISEGWWPYAHGNTIQWWWNSNSYLLELTGGDEVLADRILHPELHDTPRAEDHEGEADESTGPSGMEIADDSVQEFVRGRADLVRDMQQLYIVATQPSEVFEYLDISEDADDLEVQYLKGYVMDYFGRSEGETRKIYATKIVSGDNTYFWLGYHIREGFNSLTGHQDYLLRELFYLNGDQIAHGFANVGKDVIKLDFSRDDDLMSGPGHMRILSDMRQSVLYQEFNPKAFKIPRINIYDARTLRFHVLSGYLPENEMARRSVAERFLRPWIDGMGPKIEDVFAGGYTYVCDLRLDLEEAGESTSPSGRASGSKKYKFAAPGADHRSDINTFEIGRAPEVLIDGGAAQCNYLFAYDPSTKIGALGHINLTDDELYSSRDDPQIIANAAENAAVGIDDMIQKLAMEGADPVNVRFAIVRTEFPMDLESPDGAKRQELSLLNNEILETALLSLQLPYFTVTTQIRSLFRLIHFHLEGGIVDNSLANTLVSFIAPDESTSPSGTEVVDVNESSPGTPRGDLRYIADAFQSYNEHGALSRDGLALLEQAKSLAESGETGVIPDELREVIEYFRAIPDMSGEEVKARFPRKYFKMIRAPLMVQYLHSKVVSGCPNLCPFCPVQKECGLDRMPYPLLVILAIEGLIESAVTDYFYEPLYYRDISGASFYDVLKLVGSSEVLTHGVIEQYDEIGRWNMERLISGAKRIVFKISISMSDSDFFSLFTSLKGEDYIVNFYVNRYLKMVEMARGYVTILLLWYPPDIFYSRAWFMKRWRRMLDALKRVLVVELEARGYRVNEGVYDPDRIDIWSEEFQFLSGKGRAFVRPPERYELIHGALTDNEFSGDMGYMLYPDGNMNLYFTPDYLKPSLLPRRIMDERREFLVDYLENESDYRDILSEYISEVDPEFFDTIEEDLLSDVSLSVGTRERLIDIIVRMDFPVPLNILFSRDGLRWLVSEIDLVPDYREIPFRSIYLAEADDVEESTLPSGMEPEDESVPNDSMLGMLLTMEKFSGSEIYRITNATNPSERLYVNGREPDSQGRHNYFDLYDTSGNELGGVNVGYGDSSLDVINIQFEAKYMGHGYGETLMIWLARKAQALYPSSDNPLTLTLIHNMAIIGMAQKIFKEDTIRIYHFMDDGKDGHDGWYDLDDPDFDLFKAFGPYRVLSNDNKTDHGRLFLERTGSDSFRVLEYPKNVTIIKNGLQVRARDLWTQNSLTVVNSLRFALKGVLDLPAEESTAPSGVEPSSDENRSITDLTWEDEEVLTWFRAIPAILGRFNRLKDLTLRELRSYAEGRSPGEYFADIVIPLINFGDNWRANPSKYKLLEICEEDFAGLWFTYPRQLTRIAEVAADIAAKLRDRPLKILNYASAGGEETFSIALMVREVGGVRECRVDGLDVRNQDASRLNFFKTEELLAELAGHAEKYFYEAIPGILALRPEYNDLVTLRNGDIRDLGTEDNVDIIIANGLLGPYVKGDDIKRVLDASFDRLNQGGYLFINNSFITGDEGWDELIQEVKKYSTPGKFIEVESDNSTSSITLMKPESTGAALESTTPSGMAPQEVGDHSRSIILIEDDLAFAQTIEGFLEGRGFAVTMVDSATDGIALIEVQRGIVITDIGLTDGPEAGIRIIQAAESADLRVIVVTGNSKVVMEESERDRLRSLGADEILLKPIGIRDMLEAIERLLEDDAAGDQDVDESTSPSGMEVGGSARDLAWYKDDYEKYTTGVRGSMPENGVDSSDLAYWKSFGRNDEPIEHKYLNFEYRTSDEPDVNSHLSDMTRLLIEMVEERDPDLAEKLLPLRDDLRHISLAGGEPGDLLSTDPEIFREATRVTTPVNGEFSKLVFFPPGVIVFEFDPKTDEDLEALADMRGTITSKIKGEPYPLTRFHTTALYIKRGITPREARILIGVVDEINEKHFKPQDVTIREATYLISNNFYNTDLVAPEQVFRLEGKETEESTASSGTAAVYNIDEEARKRYYGLADEVREFIGRNKSEFLEKGLRITTCMGHSFEIFCRLSRYGVASNIYYYVDTKKNIYHFWVVTKDGFIVDAYPIDEGAPRIIHTSEALATEYDGTYLESWEAILSVMRKWIAIAEGLEEGEADESTSPSGMESSDNTPGPGDSMPDNIWINETAGVYSGALDENLFENVRAVLDGRVIETDLVELESYSQGMRKRVFLKNEAQQKGGSFKYLGVLFAVIKQLGWIMKLHPELLMEEDGLKVITQTDGNHGAAMIYAVIDAIHELKKRLNEGLYPEAIEVGVTEEHLNAIEPVVFTFDIEDHKRRLLKLALEEFRKTQGNDGGRIDYDSVNYEGAKAKQEAYWEENAATYIDHGNRFIMAGHGYAGLRIAHQLVERGVAKDEKIVIIVPVGAGGPIGVGAGLKYECAKLGYHNVKVIMVQTFEHGAFVRSQQTGNMEINRPNPPPTAILHVDGKKIPIVFDDGINVDGPESIESMIIAGEIVDLGILVDSFDSLTKTAPQLYRDLYSIYGNDAVVGGTTAIEAEILRKFIESEGGINDLDVLKEADVVVLFGTEGNVMPETTQYLRMASGIEESDISVEKPEPDESTSPSGMEGEDAEALYYKTAIDWAKYILENYKTRFGGNKLIFIGGACKRPWQAAKIMGSQHGIDESDIIYVDISRQGGYRISEEMLGRYLRQLGVFEGDGPIAIFDDGINRGNTLGRIINAVKRQSPSTEIIRYLMDSYWSRLDESDKNNYRSDFPERADIIRSAARFLRSYDWREVDTRRNLLISYEETGGEIVPVYLHFSDLVRFLSEVSDTANINELKEEELSESAKEIFPMVKQLIGTWKKFFFVSGDYWKWVRENLQKKCGPGLLRRADRQDRVFTVLLQEEISGSVSFPDIPFITEPIYAFESPDESTSPSGLALVKSGILLATKEKLQESLTQDVNTLLDIYTQGLTQDHIKDRIYDLSIDKDWIIEHPLQYEMVLEWWSKLRSLFPDSEFNDIVPNGSKKNGLIKITCSKIPEYDNTNGVGASRPVEIGSSSISIEGTNDIGYRIFKILNIAFAGSNVPENTEDYTYDADMIVEFINTQYKLLTGEDKPLINTDNLDEIIKIIRHITIILPPIERQDFNAEFELKMAKEALRAV